MKGMLMETDKRYKFLFSVGAGWNFVMSIGAFLFIGSLPSMIGIAPPLYPIFITFNLMSVFFFGCMQVLIARDLHGHMSFVKLLVWAKLAMGAVFLYSILHDAPPDELIRFLAPGIVVDVIFGLLFWRFLVYAGRKSVA